MRMLLPLILIAGPTASVADTLELVCIGQATTIETRSTFGSIQGDNGGSADGSMTSYGKARTSERVRLKIDEAGSSSIKLPPIMIPPISSGGKDTWWPIIELVATDASIKASYRLNVLNKAHMVIDRHSGDIDLKGLGFRYSGTCELQQEAPDARKF